MRKLICSDGSPFARKVRIVLAEKGLAFDLALAGDYLRTLDSLKDHNPVLQVPTLYDGERVLWGSNLILQYLFATYPDGSSTGAKPPLSPSMTRADRHWDDMQTLTTIESMADALVNYRLMVAGGPKFENTFMDRQIARVSSALDWLEPRCTAEGFWPGTFSVMDINVMCPLIYGESRKTFDFRTGRWPKITAMVDRLQARPTVSTTHPRPLS